MTDETLMEELKRGSEQSLQLLHARHAPLLFATAARTLGPAAAEDVVQEVLLAVWQSRGSYDATRGSVRSWLLEMTHSRILNELRRRHRKPGEALDLDALTASEDAPPEVAVWETQRRLALNRALEELPPSERRALRLAFFGDLSHSEVAAFLDEPLGTVKTRIRSGMGRLLRALTPVFGSTLLALIATAGGLWLVRADARRSDRAVRMLSLSDSQIIRMTANLGVSPETHGTYRWHPDNGTAVVTFSHPPAPASGLHHIAWADFDGHWTKLCALSETTPDRELCVTEAPGVGGAPRALRITAEQTVDPSRGAEPAGTTLVFWNAP